ncbi:winged helix-turn-helix transcriptional regulator [Actinosynnema mirum]|uniref:Transcriptional regulator, HxlR family n=1 Tax=Actinosynnema mirum (strain ATCC 29888 / DSM 43827 / JCM 3225 / NBRC 14064 / NCIMB 13271 / NRRL B-12336 / IMRU 3971 / 101) TaxID=446462 RepID=C6WQI2_ACTMD|nr:helix-turn-helix domain-containing protein [Actinosynnema mirum]ACU36836.1 transcriptional regulator, HxlR family [Actinosynnema mirum DSM 43827]
MDSDTDVPASAALASAGRLLVAGAAGPGCASRPVLEQVTTRWGMLIIAALIHGPHRFSRLRARVEGISQKMLSQHLKALVRANLVHREVEPTVPPQVTYSLTPLGESLSVPLTGLLSWFGAHTAELLAEPAAPGVGSAASPVAAAS